MFALSENDLQLRILGCADGPASFNAVATRRRARVTSCDPLYRFEPAEINDRITNTFDNIIAQSRENADQFTWRSIPSIEQLGKIRMSAMHEFLNDYPAGKAEGRYVDAELPALPFADASFDLTLCSHFLFLYSAQLGQEFHLRAVRELCRVATQCRIFPLLALDGQQSPFVQDVIDVLRASGLTVSIETVRYEFQRGGNQMMVIQRQKGAAAPEISFSRSLP